MRVLNDDLVQLASDIEDDLKGARLEDAIPKVQRLREELKVIPLMCSAEVATVLNQLEVYLDSEGVPGDMRWAIQTFDESYFAKENDPNFKAAVINYLNSRFPANLLWANLKNQAECVLEYL